MFGLFNKKKKEKSPPQILDLEGQPLSAGDRVNSLRYELGTCTIELDGLEYFYVSESTGQKVSYVKMIDAITGHQKVNLLTSE
jgi:hypothetical protein